MPKIEKKCEICAFYSSFYHTGTCCFWTAGSGICAKRNEEVYFYQSCNLWERDEAVPEVTPQIIDETLKSVKFIAEYFKNGK